MKAFTVVTSNFVPLPVENIDTDQIIPARFLKATTKDGFGKNLFRDWRYNNNDEAQPKKILCSTSRSIMVKYLLQEKISAVFFKGTCGLVNIGLWLPRGGVQLLCGYL